MQKIISKDMTEALMHWFELHRREMPWRGSDNPYHIWVSEMMLQQTQVATVESYYRTWIERFPDVVTLAEAPLETVLKTWEGLGYYTRARNFHKGAKYIVEHANNADQPFPDNYNEWLKVPGVGPYTAAAVSSIAFGYPAAVVDGNVKRVMARLFCFDLNISTQHYHKMLFELMNKGFFDHHPGWVNQAWMELGSLQCTPNPDCGKCPMKAFCCAFKQGRVPDLPKKQAKKKLPTRYGAAFIVEKDKKVLMLQRPAQGFLGGLWEYPGFTLKEDHPEYLETFCNNNDLQIKEELPVSVKHTYSHFHQELKLYKADLKKEWQNESWTDHRYVDEEEQNTLPRSKVTIKISSKLRNQ